MEEHFYRDRLQERYGIDVVVPGEEEQLGVHGIIYDELWKGSIRRASRQACLQIIEELTGRGAEGIVVGCTELPLLIHPDHVPVWLFDTTRLHGEAPVKLALSE